MGGQQSLKPHAGERRSPSAQPQPRQREGSRVLPSLTLMGSPTQEIRLLFCFFFLPCSIFLGDGISGMLSSTSSSSSASRTARLGHLGTQGASLKQGTLWGPHPLAPEAERTLEGDIAAGEGTHLLCKQACLLRPLPPNFTMFWQALHFPHSGCWQTWSRERGQAEHGSGDTPGIKRELSGPGKSLPWGKKGSFR